MNDLGWVFIPGGGMSDWIWRDLDSEIRERAVLVPRRLKHNTAANRVRARLSDCVDFIEELITRAGFSQVVLVAHSGGGLLAPLAAKRKAFKVERLIFVSANIPAHNTNSLQDLPLSIRLLNGLAARMQLKRDATPLRRYEKLVRKKFCNAAPEEAIEYVLGRDLLSEPLCVYDEKLDWSGLPRIPMTFIRLLNDKTASLSLQDRMAANLDIKDKYDIDADHMVMLSRPREFNAALRELAAESGL